MWSTCPALPGFWGSEAAPQVHMQMLYPDWVLLLTLTQPPPILTLGTCEGRFLPILRLSVPESRGSGGTDNIKFYYSDLQ